MGLPARKTDKHYTYGDYRTWSDDERWELIDGVAYNMSPSPGARHQSVSSNLYDAVRGFFEGKPCRVFTAPFDVLLPSGSIEDEDDLDTVVQPDMVVICDRNKVTERGCIGAPDLAVEILSPSSAAKDMTVKLDLYDRSGVGEYWIIDPGNAVLHLYTRDGGSYGAPESYVCQEKRPAEFESRRFPGLIVRLSDLFSDLWG